MFKLTFKQQVLTGFTVSLLFVFVSAITSYFSIDKLNNDTKWQSHTYDVINLLNNLKSQVLNSETGIRGYVIAGNREYLTPYQQNATKISPTIREVRRTISDNTEQLIILDSLEFYANQKLDEMKEVLRIYDIDGNEKAGQRVMLGPGQLFQK
ncbi:CHASE3 domain-containing protein [Pedobacter nyackensis]|uniref:CHASE3 domain-containing protein n=1 Tax=Pedobacter nyackensis TaxID=475255 RepID=UPI00292F8381|nr:CHASE3 domain-containing protein [Pedobacter nyackensis]